MMKKTWFAIVAALCFLGCGRSVIDTEQAACFAASELALMGESSVGAPVEKPSPTVERKTACQCGGTQYVNDRSTGRLKRVPCPCGKACRCVGCSPGDEAISATNDAEKRPEVIFWTQRGCEPCKAVLAELEACKDELPYRITVKDDTHKQPDWLPSWPTLYWCVDEEANEWRSFSPSKETPWPGVDGFSKLWIKSFPQRSNAANANAPPVAFGVGIGKLPIRATVQQVKQLLSSKGLSLPYGMKVSAPTHGLIASISQSGESVLVEFDDSTLPQVSFNGKVRRALIGETKGSVVIDGLPDLSFEVTQ